MGDMPERIAKRACGLVARERESEAVPRWYYHNFWRGLKRVFGQPRHTQQMVDELIQLSGGNVRAIHAARKRLPQFCEFRDQRHAARLLDDAALQARGDRGRKA